MTKSKSQVKSKPKATSRATSRATSKTTSRAKSKKAPALKSSKARKLKAGNAPEYWELACRELSENDPVMAGFIESYPPEIVSRGNAFETLFRSIVGQQISVKAAQSVWDRVVAALPETSPEAVLASSILRSCGLSERKVEYAKDLAKHFLDKSVNPHRWANMTDDEIIEELVTIRGIGKWTAEMFLIFHLLRPNVFPADDLGLQKGISLAYKKRYPMSKRQLEIFRKKFSPWASVATWYLWRSLDPIPVQY